MKALVIGTYLDKAGRSWFLKINAKGERHEWYAITSPLGDSCASGLHGTNSVYATGQAKYVLGKWKQLKETK